MLLETTRNVKTSVLLYCLMLFLTLVPTVRAQEPEGLSHAQKTDSIKLTLHCSRPQVSAGSPFGISADVVNISTSDIFLIGDKFVLVPPPEIDPGRPGGWPAVILGSKDPLTHYSSDEVVRLGPGEKTIAFWAGAKWIGRRGEIYVFSWRWSDWRLTLQMADFSPGDYTMTVVSHYWLDKKSAEQNADDYRSATADLIVPVIAPEWAIVAGAILGGLIAYLLLPTLRLNPSRIDFSGIGSAVLLSVVVTIMLSRIADTQLPVRITISDIWGGIAIGFIAAASGTSILKRYLDASPQARESKDGN